MSCHLAYGHSITGCSEECCDEERENTHSERRGEERERDVCVIECVMLLHVHVHLAHTRTPNEHCARTPNMQHVQHDMLHMCCTDAYMHVMLVLHAS